MCKICEQYKNGEVCNTIGKEPIGIGQYEDIWELRLWMMRDPDDDKSEDPRLNVELCASNNGDPISEFNVPIKYCPFCGREL